jgi:hypothetical protein
MWFTIVKVIKNQNIEYGWTMVNCGAFSSNVELGNESSQIKSIKEMTLTNKKCNGKHDSYDWLFFA